MDQSLIEEVFNKEVNGYSMEPITSASQKYKQRYGILDDRICRDCQKMCGQLKPLRAEEVGTYIYIKLHDHPHARCFISNTTAIQAGTAATEKYQGADWYKKWKNDLPNYYITEEEAYAAGWIPSKGNLGLVAPGKMLAKGIYRNDDGHLPTAPGRIWYEADINYHGGYRNGCRLLYSSNGLLFTTYNHYYNFCEIV